PNGRSDAFLTKLGSAGSTLVYSTFLGGAQADGATGVVVDPQTNAYLTGVTASAQFPTTSDAFDITFNGGSDAFVTKLNPAGNALAYSSFLGGVQGDQATAISLDVQTNPYVTGFTASARFPTTPGAFDRTHNGGNSQGWDAFVTRFNLA